MFTKNQLTIFYLAMLFFYTVMVEVNVRAEEHIDRQDAVYRSPIHIQVSSNGQLAYVVNQTSDSISVLDVVDRKVIDEISVGSFPSHAVLSPDGRYLYVTCLYGYKVQIVDLTTRRVVRSINTGFEPYGIAISFDGTKLYIANSLSNTVSVVAVPSGSKIFEIPVGRNPRFLAETNNGERIIVGNGLSRNVSIIDVTTGRVTETRDLGRASILRQVVCSNDGRWGFVAHLVSHNEMTTTQMERGWIHSNGFSILDLHKPGHYVTLLLDRLLKGAANPWGLVLSSDGRSLYVSLSGVHEVAIVDISGALTLVKETKPEEVQRLSQDVEIMERRHIARRVDAGGIGPRGLALNETTGELLVANYFSDTVSILDMHSGKIRVVIPLGPPREMTLRRKGEVLANDARLCFEQWFSCASCHQEDATVDALSWDLLNDGVGNPKNTKSLHDANDTSPNMWLGVSKDVDASITGDELFLGFLPQPDNHEALLAFLNSPRRAPNPYRQRDVEVLQRGERIFHRAGCNVCHTPPLYSDLGKHDVGYSDNEDLQHRFDTPSLRECYRTGPYLHDGRALTLKKIFTDYNPHNMHGSTGQLNNEELEDLLEYIRSL